MAFADNHGEKKFVFIVLTDNGNIGFGKGSTGRFNYTYVRQPIVTMPFVHANRNGDADLTFTNESVMVCRRRNKNWKNERRGINFLKS